MRVLDTVDELRRDMDALRAELPARRSVPVGVIFRVAVEAGILVAVAVIAGVGNFRPVLTVALMAAALVCVVLSEWLASRSAYVPRSFGFAQAGSPVLVYDPPPESRLESDGWERGFYADSEPARV